MPPSAPQTAQDSVNPTPESNLDVEEENSNQISFTPRSVDAAISHQNQAISSFHQMRDESPKQQELINQSISSSQQSLDPMDRTKQFFLRLNLNPTG